MFGVGLEKLVVVAVLIGVVAGPERLGAWIAGASSSLHRIRRAYRDGRRRVVDELDEVAPDWRELDPRRIDPRRIVRDALAPSEGDRPADAAPDASASLPRPTPGA